MNAILDIQELKTFFYTREGIAQAVNGISFHLNHGEIVGVVGDSGCGKSVTALSVLRWSPIPVESYPDEFCFKTWICCSFLKKRCDRSGAIGFP